LYTKKYKIFHTTKTLIEELAAGSCSSSSIWFVITICSNREIQFHIYDCIWIPFFCKREKKSWLTSLSVVLLIHCDSSVLDANSLMTRYLLLITYVYKSLNAVWIHSFHWKICILGTVISVLLTNDCSWFSAKGIMTSSSSISFLRDARRWCKTFLSAI